MEFKEIKSLENEIINILTEEDKDIIVENRTEYHDAHLKYDRIEEEVGFRENDMDSWERDEIFVNGEKIDTLNNFSDTDIELTSKIESDLKYFGIGLFDHLLVLSNGVVYSMREQPWLNKSSFNHSGL